MAHDHGRVAAVLTNADHTEAGDGDFGWMCHKPADSSPHTLVTCEPDEVWNSMPSGTVTLAISQHLTRYMATLTTAGFGVATWGRGDQPEVLIIADTQENADRMAPGIGSYLTACNS
jgi:hypothetical protein